MATLTEAIALARNAVDTGNAIRLHVSDGCLDVETDQGWTQWFPEPQYNAEEALD